jgi:hypothetical protein
MARKKAAAQRIKHTVSTEELAANPDLAGAGVKAGDVVELVDDGDVPTFTLRADSVFGIRCMMAAAGLASMLPIEEQREITGKLREFDLYEEAHRA